MDSTYDVGQSSVRKSLKLLRDTYIELHGRSAIWRRLNDNVDRRDFYGDLRKESESECADYPIKVVINHREYTDIIDYFNSVNSDNPSKTGLSDKEYHGYIKTTVLMEKGDLLLIPYNRTESNSNASLEQMKFRVIDVLSHKHVNSVSNKVMFKFQF